MPAVPRRLVGDHEVGPGVARLLGTMGMVEQGPVAGAEVGLDAELQRVAARQLEAVFIAGLHRRRRRLLQRLARQVGQARADEGLHEIAVAAMQQGQVGVEGVGRGQAEDAFHLAAVDLRRGVEERELADRRARGQIHRHDVVLVVVVEGFPVQLHPVVEEAVLGPHRVGGQLLGDEVGQEADLGAQVEAALQITGGDVGVDQRLGGQVVVDPGPPIQVMPGRLGKVVRHHAREE